MCGLHIRVCLQRNSHDRGTEAKTAAEAIEMRCLRETFECVNGWREYKKEKSEKIQRNDMNENTLTDERKR